MQTYDLIIVGGGLVGASLACALHESGLKIALIDARLPANNDQRLFALNYSSCQLLANLNLWSQLQNEAAHIQEVHVSYQGRFGTVRLRAEDVKLTNLGHVIPAKCIEAALNQKLDELSNITFYRPAKVIALEQSEKETTLKIIVDERLITLSSSIVIGADGNDSTVRSQLDIETEIFDYEQSAIVLRTKLKRSHQHIAYERFYANGAIAMLPLHNNECATIWTADNLTILELMKLPDELFLQQLQKTFGYRLGRLQSITKRYQYPIKMILAKQTNKEAVFLLGNAAHALHPIAAQGFNLALFEVATLVDYIFDKVTRGETFVVSNLNAISKQLLNQQSMSIKLSHQLAKMSDSNNKNRKALVNQSIVYQLGMVLLEEMMPFKRKFIERMLGRQGRVPSLLLDTHSL